MEIFVSPTAKVVLAWAVIDLDMNINEIKQNFEIIDVDIFNLNKKRSGALAKRKSEKTICTLWKGSTSKMILIMCSNFKTI
jgi:Ca2+-transporting ATPase